MRDKIFRYLVGVQDLSWTSKLKINREYHIHMLPTKPQSTAKILEDGFKLFILCFPKVLPLALADAALSVLLYWLIPELNSPDMTILINAMADSMPYFFLYIIIMLLLQTAIFYRINAILTQSDRGNFDALLQAGKKLLPIFLATWLYTFFIVIGFMVIIPGILFAVSLRFFTPLILFENVTVFQSLQRSHQLVRGNWWRTALILMVPLVISMFIGVIATTVASGIFADKWLEQVTYLTMDKLFNPLFYAIMLLQYYDLQSEPVEKHFVA